MFKKGQLFVTNSAMMYEAPLTHTEVIFKPSSICWPTQKIWVTNLSIGKPFNFTQRSCGILL